MPGRRCRTAASRGSQPAVIVPRVLVRAVDRGHVGVRRAAAGAPGPRGWGRYLTLPDFWSRTLQNWQSARESMPVGAAHTSTGVEG
ncbi:DUF6766 family protein [Streptomyces sp. NPDC002587]